MLDGTTVTRDAVRAPLASVVEVTMTVAPTVTSDSAPANRLRHRGSAGYADGYAAISSTASCAWSACSCLVELDELVDPFEALEPALEVVDSVVVPNARE